MSGRKSIDSTRPQFAPRSSSKENEGRARLRRKMISPSTHERFSKLKNKLGGGTQESKLAPGNSNKPLPNPRDNSSRRSSMETPRSPPTGENGGLPTGASVRTVSTPTAERSSSMTASIASPEYVDGDDDDDGGEKGANNGTEVGMDIAKLRKELTRARLEAAQAQHEKKEVEKALHQHLSDVEKGLVKLRLQQGGQPDQSGRHLGNDEMNAKSQNNYGNNDNADYTAIMKDYRELKIENSDLKRNSDRLKSDIMEARSQINEQESQCNQLQQELEDARRQVYRLEGELTRMQNDSSGAIAEKERLRQQLNRLVQQAASATPTADVYYSDDIYFQKQFSVLRGKVKDWAIRAFSSATSKSGRKISETVLKEFDRINRDWDVYMESDEHRPSFVQAFLWDYLLHQVFGLKFWESSLSSQPFERLLDELNNTRGNDPEYQRLYHEWRSTGARLAAPIGSEQLVIKNSSSARVDRVVRNISDFLDSWCTMGKTQFDDSLRKILADAILLDLKMQQQRAIFTQFGSKELWELNESKYDPAIMEVRHGKISKSKEQFVVLLIAPLLVKRGNSDGQNYNTRVVIEKAQVDIEVPKKKRAHFGVS